MDTPDGYARSARDVITSTIAGELDTALGIGSAGVDALLAVAAAINRLADAVAELGTPPVYQPGQWR